MLTLSTHDTKRGEDVRARINVLSELPLDWRAALMRWRKMNHPHKSTVNGELVPDGNDEYLFYQTLIGAWPAHSPSAEELMELRERMTTYMQKATQEAKIHTSWVNPNEAYDRALQNFVQEVLVADANNEFISDLAQFLSRIAYSGMLNSLSQSVLKMTAPGVPDFYQGTELWDLNLVDPDNRRPVDFTKRRAFLEQLKRSELADRAGLLAEALSHWQDGRIKLYIIDKILNFRRERKELFEVGSYQALYASARFRENICAFARRLNHQWVIVAVSRLLARVLPPGHLPLGEAMWKNETLPLPDAAPDLWRNVLTGENLPISPTKNARKELGLRDIFKSVPVAVLEGEATASRG
jgi:(1->4)-alpha-D-glucan 1-alpha-D-glucosylmutase